MGSMYLRTSGTYIVAKNEVNSAISFTNAMFAKNHVPGMTRKNFPTPGKTGSGSFCRQPAACRASHSE